MNPNIETINRILSEMEAQYTRARPAIADTELRDLRRLLQFARFVMKTGRGTFANFWAEELAEILEGKT